MRDALPGNAQSIKALAQAQFGPAAGAYVTSSTHAHGADLARLVELAAPAGHERLLDVATGGGHTALAFVPYVAHVVASDLTLPMLQAARTYLSAQGATQVAYLRCEAERLPVAPASFELITCRVAAHHFADVPAFVQSSASTLCPGGLLLISDHIGLEDAEQDAFMDRFERWRDPSHVRAYRFADWQRFCAEAGLRVVLMEADLREPYLFADWTARLRMPKAAQEELERWLLAAPSHLRERFELVEQDGQLISLRGNFGIVVAEKVTR